MLEISAFLSVLRGEEKEATMELNDVTQEIIGAAMKVHSKLGPGLLESAYEACLEYELKKRGFKVERQKALPVVYEDVELDCGYRIDLLVGNSVIVELKAIEKLQPIHDAQLLSYLKLADLQVGLLINFHVVHLREGIKRLVNNYQESSPLRPSSPSAVRKDPS
jgi:GxxExxY protein